MYFKTLGKCYIGDFRFGLLVIMLLRKPFISVKWWRDIDDLRGVLNDTNRCWIEFSLHTDDGKKI
jgi:hypothetical protein